MISNLDKYRKDLDALIDKGVQLNHAIQKEYAGAEFETYVVKNFADKAKARKFLDALPSFSDNYQAWYSEAKTLIHQLLPDRLDDFTRYYERPKNRRDLTYANYKIEDSLDGLSLSTEFYQEGKALGPHAALPMFRQQLAILKSVKRRFESSLFDIHQLVQADVFDSELDAAEELAKNKFARAAGAVAGVILERHLGQVSDNHSVKVAKKAPGISDFNDALKSEGVIDTAQWRFIQHLGDLRNLCDHNKGTEPTKEQVNDLIAGVKKISKTVL